MATSYLHPPASSQVRKMLLLHVAMNRAGAFSVRSRSKNLQWFLQFKGQHHVCHKGFPEFTIHFYDSTLPSFLQLQRHVIALVDGQCQPANDRHPMRSRRLQLVKDPIQASARAAISYLWVWLFLLHARFLCSLAIAT